MWNMHKPSKKFHFKVVYKISIGKGDRDPMTKPARGISSMELETNSLEETNDSLQVKQLIYSSFYEQGFALLTSRDIPSVVCQSFTQRFVQTFWDPYLPPHSDYRAGYLCQLPLETPGTLFGWLYHDGYDEIGRSDIPYFIAYYLSGLLQPNQLSAIFTCLEQGPISWIDRCNALSDLALETLTIENVRNSQAVRQGVAIPNAIRVQSYEAMQSQVLIDYFFANTSEQTSPDSPQSHYQDSLLERRLPESIEHRGGGLTVNPSVNTTNLEDILQDLMSKPIGIHGAVVVSADGLAMTKPMGLDESISGILAGTMIYLAQNTQTALNWQEVELISIRASEGYIILSRCSVDAYLLIQSRKVPVGLLEGEINQTVAKLRTALNPTTENSSLIFQAASKPQNYLPMESGFEKPLDLSDEVTYRGRRASS
jgi:predicted regulator of Ras-like GTPase activity (Roadblock/LC7/MglB family)